MPEKYIYVDGIPAVNPKYQVTSSPINKTLAIVSTLEDQTAMSQLTNLALPLQLQETLATLQNPAYIASFHARGLDAPTLIAGITNFFAQNEIPIGLMSKLTSLQGATLHFKIDDSTSMNNESLLTPDDACSFTKKGMNPSKERLTRWEEAEDRMHNIVELLAFVPTGLIIISFFDHPERKGDRITLDRRGRSHMEFLQQAHDAIHRLFAVEPEGDTPILLNLENMLNEANELRGNTIHRTMHYLLSDGQPSGKEKEIRKIKNFLLDPNRIPELNPLTLVSCSNLLKDYRWQHEVAEVAPFVAALTNFADEFKEVKEHQGSAFPYTNGMWSLCNLAAVINKNDLDAMNKHAPLTRITIENFMGRVIMENEYRWYFTLHPNATRVFGPDYSFFLNTVNARDIPSVEVFLSALKEELCEDIDNANVDTEALVLKCAEEKVVIFRNPKATLTPCSSTLFAVRNTMPHHEPVEKRSCVCALI